MKLRAAAFASCVASQCLGTGPKLARSQAMPDERQESTKQGIAPAPESEIGRAADARRREEVTHEPASARPDAGMGGTSDADSAGDEAWTPSQSGTPTPNVTQREIPRRRNSLAVSESRRDAMRTAARGRRYLTDT
jgi:hypothetical protein